MHLFSKHLYSKASVNTDNVFIFWVTPQVRSRNMIFSSCDVNSYAFSWTLNSLCFPQWYVCKQRASLSGQNKAEVLKRGTPVLKPKSKTENVDGNLASGAPSDLVSLYTINLKKQFLQTRKCSARCPSYRLAAPWHTEIFQTAGREKKRNPEEAEACLQPQGLNVFKKEFKALKRCKCACLACFPSPSDGPSTVCSCVLSSSEIRGFSKSVTIQSHPLPG